MPIGILCCCCWWCWDGILQSCRALDLNSHSINPRSTFSSTGIKSALPCPSMLSVFCLVTFGSQSRLLGASLRNLDCMSLRMLACAQKAYALTKISSFACLLVSPSRSHLNSSLSIQATISLTVVFVYCNVISTGSTAYQKRHLQSIIFCISNNNNTRSIVVLSCLVHLAHLLTKSHPYIHQCIAFSVTTTL
jgi:hypothetical protein